MKTTQELPSLWNSRVYWESCHGERFITSVFWASFVYERQQTEKNRIFLPSSSSSGLLKINKTLIKAEWIRYSINCHWMFNLSPMNKLNWITFVNPLRLDNGWKYVLTNFDFVNKARFIANKQIIALLRHELHCRTVVHLHLRQFPKAFLG